MAQSVLALRTLNCRRRPRAALRAGSCAGFTLIEMMVVVAVLLITSIAAALSFSGTISGYRIAGAANSLSRDLQFARSEALKRGQPVSVCASTNAASCSSSTAWQSGWIVFYDPDGDGAVNAGDTILRAETQNPGTTTFTADNAVTSVTFNRQGSIAALPANPVTFTLHDGSSTPNAALTRCVALMPSGRSTVQNTNAGNCL